MMNPRAAVVRGRERIRGCEEAGRSEDDSGCAGGTTPPHTQNDANVREDV